MFANIRRGFEKKTNSTFLRALAKFGEVKSSSEWSPVHLPHKIEKINYKTNKKSNSGSLLLPQSL